MLTCALIGHRFAFTADGATMRWRCERGCGAGGSKEYAGPAEARRYARALDRRDSDDLGRRGPLVATLPLRIAHALRGGAPQRRGSRGSREQRARRP